jgi:hypothetical protein
VAANASEEASAASARIGVQLSGTPRRRVSVQLAVLLPPAQPAAAGNGSRNASSAARWAAADPAQLWLEPDTLSWAAWERPSTKHVTLRSATELPLALALQGALGAASGRSAADLPPGQPLLRVALAAAQGATIARPQNATSLVMDTREMDSEEADGGLPLFGFDANQVAYPPSSSASNASNASGGVARVPVRLLAGQLQQPATVRFAVQLLAPLGTGLSLQQFLPTRASHGFLYFRPSDAAALTANGSTAAQQQPLQQVEAQWVELPLAWDRIPPEAEYRLGLEVDGVYSARVAPQLGAVALHVFGTRQGTCPPGSVLVQGPRDDTGGSGGFWQSSGGSDAAAYDDVAGGGPFGLTFNGSVIDLSSAFQSE